MLVSKTKPCMSKYTLTHSKTANGSLNQLWFLRQYHPTWITVAILELIHASKAPTRGGFRLAEGKSALFTLNKTDPSALTRGRSNLLC